MNRETLQLYYSIWVKRGYPAPTNLSDLGITKVEPSLDDLRNENTIMESLFRFDGGAYLRSLIEDQLKLIAELPREKIGEVVTKLNFLFNIVHTAATTCIKYIPDDLLELAGKYDRIDVDFVLEELISFAKSKYAISNSSR